MKNHFKEGEKLKPKNQQKKSDKKEDDKKKK